MSLFKERTLNAKKVIMLQNEINSLKTKLASATAVDTSEIDSLKSEIQNIKAACALHLEEIKVLKAELKKVKSENTRLKKKLEGPSS